MNSAPARTQSAAAAIRRYVICGSTPGHDGLDAARRGHPVDALLRHPLGGEARVHDLDADVAQLPVQAPRADRQDAPDLWVALLEVEGRGPWCAHDSIGRHRRAEVRQAPHVVGPVVHRVVGDVDDVVAQRRSGGEDGGNARDGILAAIDDAIEVDEQEEGHPRMLAARGVRTATR